MFKLLGKIRDCQQRGLLQHSSGEVEAIMRDYTGIIRHKIDNLVGFSNNNFINTSCYEEYKDCSDYSKLMKIAK